MIADLPVTWWSPLLGCLLLALGLAVSAALCAAAGRAYHRHLDRQETDR